MAEKKDASQGGGSEPLESSSGERKRLGKIARLPDKLRDELDGQLREGSFRSCRALSKWLADNGYTISHAAIHKYGQNFERRLDAVRIASEQARLVCEQY